ncbi:nephrin-like isoform X2 [Ornithodoros turicata]|uniref:nephrin-like isoform X2 n=1 Tax=Ornithodoros turicata TaxID=34597 RepID=UPI00313A4AAB
MRSYKFTLRDTPAQMLIIVGCLLLRTVHGQQQSFRVRPEAKEVIEGHTIELRCEVANQAGAVQWSKDGFVLGFNRSIPGYPRYTMIGDPAQGVHNIRIENATLEDDAEYQCQVGPTSDHKAIRADARLTVLLPPASLTIKDHPNGSSVEVRQSESVTLTCVVSQAKPAAQLKWFRKNVELRPDNVQYSVEDGEGGRQNAISSLTLTPHPDDNGVTYSCEAIHSSLSRPIVTSVKLGVFFPPGPPEIHGYTEGETIRMGDTTTLRCISRGGNPLAQLVWYRNNEERSVDSSYTTSGRESINTLTFVANSSDNNAVYRCVASNVVSPEPMAASVKLTVQFAPSKVTVRGPKEAKAGDQITMRCKTERSNPAAQVSWVVDGRPFTSVSTVTADPKGGWVTSSNITVNITGQERNMKMFSCYAVNQDLGDTVVETAAVSILYAPDPPRIFGYTEGTPIRAKTLQHITCVTNGGNPLPTLQWYKGSTQVNSTSKINGNAVSSEVAIIAQDSDNGAEYRCEASNAATKKPLKTAIKLTVYFPPTAVTIKVKPRRPRSGQRMTLTCETGSSHPQSTITWWKDGLQLSGGVDDVVVDAPYGGKAAKNVFVVNVTADDDRANYMCQATNKALQLSVHDSVTLDVTYKPEFYNAPLERFDIVEGESLVINLTARANPPSVTYTWTKDDQKVLTKQPAGEPPATVLSSGSLLNLTNVVRSDGGVYYCEAQNNEGSAKTSILINIQYGSTIVRITESVIVDAGSNAQLECEVDAKPFDSETVSWRRTGYDMARTRSAIEDRRSYLTVYNVSREDSGKFECVAHNGIGGEVVKVANLIVKFRPEIDRGADQLKAAGKEGASAELVCRAQAAPNATFSWSREGVAITVDSRPEKYDIAVAQTGLLSFESTLIVKNIRSSDYGPYECVARNELGFDSAKVHLDTVSAPDPPLQMSVVNATYNTLTVVWRPGFDGGLPQSFRIRFRVADSNEGYHYQDILFPNATMHTVGGLLQNTEYTLSIMAFNDWGQGQYLKDIIKGKTTDDAPAAPKQHVEPPAKIDIPKIIITSVSVVGTSLLLLNIVLVICFVRKRRKKRLEEESDQSSKTATIEMYAPSSYNETMNGETVSSTSEKSEAYSNEHSAEYSEESSKPAATTYLIDQGSDTYVPDGSLHYAPYNRYSDEVVPSVAATAAGNESIDRRMLPNRRVHYEGDADYYSDALRRNAYNQKLGDKVAYGKVSGGGPAPPPPPGRTSASGLDTVYNINTEQQRYVPFPVSGSNVAVHHQTDLSGQPVLSTFSPSSNASMSPVLASMHNYGPPLVDGPGEMDGHLV